jgi:hypothetical protein
VLANEHQALGKVILMRQETITFDCLHPTNEYFCPYCDGSNMGLTLVAFEEISRIYDKPHLVTAEYVASPTCQSTADDFVLYLISVDDLILVYKYRSFIHSLCDLISSALTSALCRIKVNHNNKPA